MEKEYYYLDGKDQKGPFTTAQLSRIGLKPDTLVWTEGMDNWQQAKDISELSDLIKKSPPSPPIIDNYQTVRIPDKVAESNAKTIVADSNVKLWVTIKILASIILLLILVSFIGYSFLSIKRDKLKKEIIGKINNVFDGKSLVMDGENYEIEGSLEDTGFNKSGTSTFSEPWTTNHGLYTIFDYYRGGFTVKKLTRINVEKFDLVTITSGDMGYNEPKYSYQITGSVWDGNGVRNTYGNSSNYRMPVQQCYNHAFSYFTTEDKTGGYSPGKLVDLTNFLDNRNEYYYIWLTYPMDGSSPDWMSQDGHTSYVAFGNVKVFYWEKGQHLELLFNQLKFEKDLLFIIGISWGVILLIILVIGISKPKLFRNLSLFGKRWENTLFEEQVFFFEYSFFGDHKFTEIINEVISKGILKITDRGNTINLSYPNKELFYKIEEIRKDSLVVSSFKDGSRISFSRIGSKRPVIANQE